MKFFVLIAILLGVTPLWAVSRSTCVDLFTIAVTENLTPEEILIELNKANPLNYNPNEWPILGTNKPDPITGLISNKHITYLVPAGRVQGVLKIGATTYITEPLAMKLGQILKIKIPPSIGIKVGGRKASLQYFVSGVPTAEQAGDVQFSYKTEFFDYIFLNFDRHTANYLIEKDGSEILIDNEHILNAQQISYYQQHNNPPFFLHENLKKLWMEDPEFAALLYDRQTEKQIAEAIKASQIKEKQQILDWISFFFGFYRNYYRDLRNIPNPADSPG